MADQQHQSLTISLVNPETAEKSSSSSSSGSPFLRIEQEDLPEKSADGFGDWAAGQDEDITFDNFMEYWEQYGSQCDSDGVIEITLLVYYWPAVDYTMTTDNGSLSEPLSVDSEVDRTIPLTGLSSEYGFDERVGELISATWNGSVYGTGGVIISPPAISFDGENNRMYWGSPALGTIVVRYRRQVDEVVLTISPRENVGDVEEAYKTTVRAFWDDNVTSLEVELPDNIDTCGGYVDAAKIDDEDDRPVNCMRRILYVDPCDEAKIISEEFEPMACPEAGGGTS